MTDGTTTAGNIGTAGSKYLIGRRVNMHTVGLHQVEWSVVCGYRISLSLLECLSLYIVWCTFSAQLLPAYQSYLRA